MLELREGGPVAEPLDAASLIVLRSANRGFEVFCVERAKGSRFLGGAIVFPGGRVEADDRSEAWREVCRSPGDVPLAFASVEEHAALSIAACRETLEEAEILFADGAEAAAAHTARTAIESGSSLRSWLRQARLQLDLDKLHPFGRWITPTSEPRRFDTRFFVAVLPPGQSGRHDARETVASFWLEPEAVLARFSRGEIQLAPPTHRLLELLVPHASPDEVLAASARMRLDPICPKLVRHVDARGETKALVLPGDPEHDLTEAIVPGASRYVLREGFWRAEDPPARDLPPGPDVHQR